MNNLLHKLITIVLSINNRFGLLISSLIILFFFFISHYWFFNYLPLTHLNPDGIQYLSLRKLLSIDYPIQVGYPSYGLILYFSIVTFFFNSLSAISYANAFISLTSILFLNFSVFKNINKKFILFLGLALGVFLAKSSTVFFNTYLSPDSILSSLYIFFSGCLIFLIKGKKAMLWSILMAFITAYSIFIRPTSLVLIPICIAIIVFLLIQKKRIPALVLSCSIVFFLLIVATHNYFNPLYKSFSIYSKSSGELKEYFDKYYYGLESDDTEITTDQSTSNVLKFSEIVDLLPTENVLFQAKHAVSWKKLYEARYSTMRGVILRFDSISGDIHVLNHGKSYMFSVDSLIADENIDKYNSLKQELYEQLSYSEILYGTEDKRFYWKMVLFRQFYRYFYSPNATETRPLYYGTIAWRYNLYSDEEKLNRHSFYVDIYSDYHGKPELRDILLKHCLKEFYHLHKNDDFNFEQRYAAMQNNIFLKIYDIYLLKIHFNVFQNFFTFLIAMLVFISAIFYLFFVNIRSKTAFIVFCIGLILVGLSMIHALHFVYYRYTYSSSFVYFVFLGMTPALVYMAYIKFKEKPIKELIKFQIPLLLRKKSLK